jgi:hypothetical protein
VSTPEIDGKLGVSGGGAKLAQKEREREREKEREYIAAGNRCLLLPPLQVIYGAEI